EICNLDDDNDLKRFGITLDQTLKKGDYYVHRNNCKWIVVERKDKPSRIEYTIRQISSTVEQLLKQGKPVHQVMVICEKISKNEGSAYGVLETNNGKFLYAKSSPKRNPISIHGMGLEYCSTNDVERMRRGRF